MNGKVMFNSYKSVRSFLAEASPLHTYLINGEVYWAHKSKDNRSQHAPETLADHVDLVNTYFVDLVDKHHLDAVIDRLIFNYLTDYDITDKNIGNEVKKLFINSIYFHDFGKVNENFQVVKMTNPHFHEKYKKESPILNTHAPLGAFIYLAKHIDDLLKEKEGKNLYFLVATAFYFSYSIFKHHAYELNDNLIKTLSMANLFANRDEKEIRDFLSTYLDAYQYDIHPNVISLLGNRKFLEDNILKFFSKSSVAFVLIKLNFSLLTASDYLATNEYLSGLPPVDYGVLTKSRIDEIYAYATKTEFLDQEHHKINFNAHTYSDLEGYTLLGPKEMSGANLNILRKEMGIEVLRNIRGNLTKNLFYIEAPTGGGKTNLSILATLELLKEYQGSLNKVFYVFPFTTLITQTYSTLAETLGLASDELVEFHSRSGIAEKNDNDALYGKDRINYIANLFAHYPISLLSHIRFFDILKTNKKEANYLLHRLANSVVVIDELQSYNPSHWDKIIYFIKYYAKAFNIKFILMSATLPKLDKLEVLKEKVNDFVYLIPEARQKYFQNPNFSERVKFNFEYFERSDLQLDELMDRVILESQAYANEDYGMAKPKGSVFTIVEFIYKQSASSFYELLGKHQFFDEIFVLSGSILEHRRRYIIDYLKSKHNRTKKILLITTQVVEAGVDIDMDLGFKDRSLIDSDEQLAGRINRNVNKHNCKLFLFNYNRETTIYGKDSRLKITKEKITVAQYKKILESKDFDLLYDLVLNDRNVWNNKELFVNFNEYQRHIEGLRFTKVQEQFKLIETKNIACFVPLDLPIFLPAIVHDNKKAFFNDIELKFLANNRIYPSREGTISGVQVFDLYIDIIHNRIDFMEQKIREKVLQSILSKYVISMFSSDKIEQQIIHFSDLEKSKYGYQYLERWRDFYNVERGLDKLAFNGIEETQFL
ncbi:CRISPR-associated helicase Cas3' [Sphingobacterium sp. Mn56C]|uniref:CRISPR-associated helicase Cas3' n=1 Tax=Sphingobacterium sp. Mn56C TaxID=3395261 RepID=UPI003BBB0ECE